MRSRASEEVGQNIGKEKRDIVTIPDLKEDVEYNKLKVLCCKRISYIRLLVGCMFYLHVHTHVSTYMFTKVMQFCSFSIVHYCSFYSSTYEYGITIP